MEDQELANRMHAILDQYRAAPFLFAGTGLSRRYLGVEDWEGLLRRYANEINTSFDVLLSRAKREVDDQSRETELYPFVGSLLDDAFFETWIEDDKYAEARDRLQEKGEIPTSPLKHEIAKYLESLSSQELPVHHENEPPDHEKELAKLREATIDGVITTNYDLLLEQIFKDQDYTVYVGQNELIFEEQHSVAEIYKIHGSCKRHDSIVLTKDDYDRFNERNAYLAAKLITIFLEHPVVFLGYSIRDENIRGILRQVIRCLDARRLAKLSERLIFVEWDEDPKPPTMSSREFDIMEDGKSLEVTRVKTHSFLPVYEALARANRQMSAKLMRRMKEQVYQLALTQEPQDQIFVVDIEDAESHDDVEFVMGVGVHERISKVGATGIGIDELFDDLVTDGNRFDRMASAIVTDTIRDWLNPGYKLAPVYKYMSRAGFLEESGLPEEGEIPGKVVDIALLPQSDLQYPTTEATVDAYREKTVSEVLGEGRERHLTAAYLTLVRNPDTNQIWNFIEENRDLLKKDGPGQGYMKRLAVIYDREHYGPGFEAIERYRSAK